MFNRVLEHMGLAGRQILPPLRVEVGLQRPELALLRHVCSGDERRVIGDAVPDMGKEKTTPRRPLTESRAALVQRTESIVALGDDASRHVVVVIAPEPLSESRP